MELRFPVRARGPWGDIQSCRAWNYSNLVAGIAYAIHDNSRPELSNINSIMNWGDHMSNDVKIPSIISYSPSIHKGEQQFGASLSPDAVAMVNTKLELETQDTRLDELDLIIRVLEGTKDLNFEHVKRSRNYPAYTWKSPEDIVTDYLTKAFEHFEKGTDHVNEIKYKFPVDIMITVPVVCLKSFLVGQIASSFQHRNGLTKPRILRSRLYEMQVSMRMLFLT